ncbi:MAG: hypothetical protein LBB45_01405 [Methanobrevibacter sp.]|jgi:hypothetical protein|nr:hypothetical protein [Candidatus Methanovirga basalitermitum]
MKNKINRSYILKETVLFFLLILSLSVVCTYSVTAFNMVNDHHSMYTNWRGFNHIGLSSFNQIVINPTNGTIADALKVSDDVLLSPGTYTGEGNTNISIIGNKYIHALNPKTVTIDGENKSNLFNVNDNSNLNLTNIELNRGNSGEYGGGILSNGMLNIKNCIFQNNIASNGCAVFINNTNVTMENTTFKKNGELTDSKAIQGSGLFINGTSNCNINNSIITDNKGLTGAGLVSTGSLGEKSKITINNSLIFDNNCFFMGSGLMCIYSNVSIESSKIYGNIINNKYDKTNSTAGGGIFASNSNLQINNSGFNNNEALIGSGLCSYDGSTKIEESNFTNNHARRYGGGISIGQGRLL